MIRNKSQVSAVSWENKCKAYFHAWLHILKTVIKWQRTISVVLPTLRGNILASIILRILKFLFKPYLASKVTKETTANLKSIAFNLANANKTCIEICFCFFFKSYIGLQSAVLLRGNINVKQITAEHCSCTNMYVLRLHLKWKHTLLEYDRVFHHSTISGRAIVHRVPSPLTFKEAIKISSANI